MVDVLYSVIEFFCFFILLVILYKVQSNEIKKNKKRENQYFCILIILVLIYCFIDGIWGLIASHYLISNIIVFYVLSYLLYFLVSLISFVYFLYVEICCELDINKRKLLLSISLIPFIMNMGLLILNSKHFLLFKIEQNFSYYVSPKVSIFIIFQFIYVAIVFIQVIINLIRTKDSEKRKKYSVIFFFVISLIICSYFQFYFNEGPFTGLGFTVSIFIGYIFTTSREKEQLLIKAHEAENLLKIENNQQVIQAFANSYELMYIFNVKGGEPNRIKGGEIVEQYLNKISDPRMIFSEMINHYVVPEYIEEMKIFTNKASVGQRMGNLNIINKEFISKEKGWCKASWIRIKNDEKGNLETAIFSVRNIDTEKRKEIEYQNKLKNALKNQNEIYAEMLQLQSNGMVAVDMHDNVIMINEVAIKMFGFEKAEDVTTINDILVKFDSVDKEETVSKLHKLKIYGGKYTFEFSVNDVNNVFMHVIAYSKVTYLSNGDKIILTSFADITNNKKMERELVILSETDALTGINNRGSGERKTELLITGHKKGMLCLLDADKFKSINDNFGHVVGDKVIIRIAECLKNTFRDEDVVMRLGGDEFAVYALGVETKEEAALYINRFFKAIDESEIEELKGRKFSVSLGAVICEDLENQNFDDFYQMADKAMYNSKKIDGNHFEFYK